MSAVIDMTGQRFGSLVVAARAESAGGQAKWRCRCDCGAETIVSGGDLRSGHSKSCGCAIPRHGLGRPPEYEVWKAMRRRCENPRDRDYPHYGGRGIAVCERWRRFATFWADMGPRPTPGHQIERRDNDEGYSPENCTWATKVEQMANTRRSRRFAVGDESLTAAEYARRTGVAYSTAYSQLTRMEQCP
jgi:hypothetical protein